MDKVLRAEIVAEVRKAMMEVNERWLSADELCNQFQMLSKDWLRRNGWRLPRGRMEFPDENGKVTTRWAYPQHKISQMIHKEGLRLP